MEAIHQSDVPIPTLDQLIANALIHLEELGYTSGSREHYVRVWRALVDYARDTRLPPKLTPQLANDFLASQGASPRLSQQGSLSRTQKQTQRGLRVLLEFQATGSFQRRSKRGPNASIPTTLKRELARYEEFCSSHLHLRPATLCVRRRTLNPFLAFLGSQGVTTLAELQPSSLSDYILTRSREIQPRTLATQVGDIRSLLRFHCMEGLVSSDLVAHAKTLRFSTGHHLPPVWPTEVVEALLAAIDRASLIGKRNYAILLLACRLGLRVGDIRSLRFDNLYWAEARLTITQQKTGTPLSLPLDDELGKALIDYIRCARPAVRHRELFLRMRAPFEPFSSSNCLRNVVVATLRRAQIDIAPGLPQGMHALRHTLATRLVRAGEPLESVAGILGHRSIETTRIYTHLDVESLRSVALDSEEVHHG